MFPMITHVLSVSEIQGLRDLCICHIFNFQKWLESLLFIWSLDSHLYTYGNLFLASAISQIPCSFVMAMRRLRMAPPCVAVGQLVSK